MTISPDFVMDMLALLCLTLANECEFPLCLRKLILPRMTAATFV